MKNNITKKRLLFINGHLNVGGVEKSLVDVLRHLDYDQFDVDLLLLEGIGDYEDELPTNVRVILRSLENTQGPLLLNLLRNVRHRDWFSFKMRIILLVSKIFGQKWIGLAKHILTEGNVYDCVIGYRSGICTQLAAYGVNARRRIAWWHHGCMNFSGKAAEILEMAYRQMNSIVAVSSSSALLVAEAFPDIKSKIKVIPNMIVTNELYDKSKQFDPEEFQKSEFKIVSVGRMSPEKNMIMCPYIADLLKKKGISFRWVLIGDGVEEQKVEMAISQLELKEDMIMVGKKSNPCPYIAMADLMIHPSLVESQGITLLESMVLRTPVVANSSMGPQEFIKSGINGYLVKNDVEEIAQIIEALYFNRKLCSIVADNAANDVRQFETEEIMKKINKILEG